MPKQTVDALVEGGKASAAPPLGPALGPMGVNIGQVVAEINSQYLGQTVPVLVEESHKGKWRGRTPQNKLVFFEDDADWRGRVAEVEITWTGPWSMQGRLPQTEPGPEPIMVFSG